MNPEFQLNFLNKIQRLFSQGDFTATYKFALLISIADIAVEIGDDNDECLSIKFELLGQKFIELYWQQAVPFVNDQILWQNNSRQARIITLIKNFKAKNNIRTINQAKILQQYSTLLRDVTNVVKKNPIKYIQNIEGSVDHFLFEEDENAIILKSGISFCFRRFQSLIQNISQNRWIDQIKRYSENSKILGNESDLKAFLFDTSRQSLLTIRDGLLKISDRCFYCNSIVNDFDVDHFIPHSLFHRNLIENFVVSCPRCNRSKSDTLAAKVHLSNWREFSNKHKKEIAKIGNDAGILSDNLSMHSIVRWSYNNAISSGSKGWLRAKQYELIDESYKILLKI